MKFHFIFFDHGRPCAFTLNVRSMLGRSKPFTLDKDRSFLHRSSLDQSICASVNGVYDENSKKTI